MLIRFVANNRILFRKSGMIHARINEPFTEYMQNRSQFTGGVQLNGEGNRIILNCFKGSGMRGINLK